MAGDDKKADVWMPIWIGSYLADTLELTTVQHGAYFLLLLAYWRKRSPLIDNDDSLRSITKLEKADWRKHRPVLAGFFKVGDGVWWHKRVEAELAAAEARAKKAAEKASKAAQARWAQQPEQSPSNAPSMLQALPKDVLEECPPPSPIPPSEKTPHTPRGGKAAVSLKTWADETRAKGEKLIPDDDSVFAYAAEVGIPDDFMALAWVEFKHRYTQPGAKRYKDWRSVFRKAVRGNWLKLWYLDGESYRLTTVGHQAMRSREAA